MEMTHVTDDVTDPVKKKKSAKGGNWYRKLRDTVKSEDNHKTERGRERLTLTLVLLI